MRRAIAPALLLCCPASVAADVRLPRILSDGVVLQREARVPVFGFADPLERVTVRASWGASGEEAVCDQDGTWRTTLLTPAAGGPFTLEVRGRNVVTVSDVMVGEVWLCSGQSNMEMPIAPLHAGYTGVLDWQREVSEANFPAIRVFSVQNDVAVAPRDDVRGAWNAVTPASAGALSATAYFFGRKLHQELGVPIGLVDATWGGTPAEAWTSGIALARLPEFAADVRRLEAEARAPEKAAREKEREIAGWQASIEESDHGLRERFDAATFDDSSWATTAVPGTFTDALANHDGVVWMRRTVELPPALAGRDLVLETGPIDDFDTTWFDGTFVGASTRPDSVLRPRSYAVPARLATPGRHVIAVRVLDTGGPGGIGGPSRSSRAGGSTRVGSGSDWVALDGPWRVRAGAPMTALAPRPDVDIGPHTPSALYNAMIAPLTQFRMRGVIWYQGESNRRRAFQYKTLFPALITDWRARFSNGDMPFYYVQIAPFAYAGDKGEAAELREAQRLALQVPNTGMVVTTDIGDEHDIHPKNKQAVGGRLALWALAKTYGRDVDLGALPASPVRDDGMPWITARAPKRERWARREDRLSLSAPIDLAEEGVPLGNGHEGVLLWGGERKLRLQIGTSDVWLPPRFARPLGGLSWKSPSPRPKAEPLINPPESPFPPPPPVLPSQTPPVSFQLELWEAEARSFSLDLSRGEGRAELTRGSMRLFVSSARTLVMARAEGTQIDPAWDPDRLFANNRPISSAFPPPDRVHVPGEHAAISFRSAGHVLIALAAARRENAGGTDIALAIVDGAESSDPLGTAIERATAAVTTGYAQLFAEHVTAYRTVTGPSRVTLGDAELQTQYDLARHLLASGSRRDAPPLSLQGIWPDELPAGRGAWLATFDAPATYWPCATAGLFESELAYLDFHWKLLPRLREVARDDFGAGGAVVPGTMRIDGSPLGNGGFDALSPTLGAWTAAIFARRWRITSDETFLRDRAWPWCSAIGQALSDLAPQDAAGKRKLPISTSPGYHEDPKFGWLKPNSNFDLALMRSCFADLEAMARSQHLDDEAERWRRTLSELDDFALDEQGALAVAPGEPYAESTQRPSHLLAIHPLGLISIEGSPGERAIVDASLDGVLEKGSGNWLWSVQAWFACLAARAGRPETALRFLREHCSTRTLRNGFACETDPSRSRDSDVRYRPRTISGNMLEMEAVHEMLLQSWGGVVRVFPAASVTWPEASFEGLRAEGGFVVSARRAGGVTAEVRVRATLPGTLRLRDPFAGATPAWNRPDVARAGADWIVDLRLGEELVGTRAAGR